jgi:uncharacterized protein (DUF58 family)
MSRSMAFPPDRQSPPHRAEYARRGPRSKFDLARAAAAVLATLVIDQGDAAGLLAVAGADTRETHYIPARSGRHHLHLYLAALARLSSTGTDGVTGAVRRVGTLLRRRGLVVVISDFYEEETALSEIRRLARMGHDVVVIHVMAQEELALPRGGAVEFEDLETGATLTTSPDQIAEEYRAAVRGFLNRMKQAVQREGLDYLRLVTGEPLEPVLRRFLVGRRGGE